jgi:hypothetical protein
MPENRGTLGRDKGWGGEGIPVKKLIFFWFHGFYVE